MALGKRVTKLVGSREHYHYLQAISRVNRLDAIVDTNLDNCVNVEVLGYRALAYIKFKGLVCLVSVLCESICRREADKKRFSTNG